MPLYVERVITRLWPARARLAGFILLLSGPLLIAIGAPSATFTGEERDAASDDDSAEDDEPQHAAGLVARYQSEHGKHCLRRDDAIQFDWQGRAPDERLPTGRFLAEWHGLLNTLTAGEYRFFVYAAGETTVRVDDTTLLSTTGDQPGWHESPPIELAYGHHGLRVTFRSTADGGQLRLYWSGPRFALEPIPPRVLFHQPAETPKESFERGAELWRALRCANCHQVHQPAKQSTSASAPALTHLAGNLRRRWLIDWLCRDRKEATSGTHAAPERMPSFGLAQKEAEAIAAYLNSASRPTAANHEPRQGDAHRGQDLFLTLGCLACHQWDGLGTGGLVGGGDLTYVADKRPPDFFRRWLADPNAINPAHRMPVFQLAADELDDLAAFLARLRTPGGEQREKAATPLPSLVATGRRLVSELRCGACHDLPDAKVAAPVVWQRPPTELNWSRGCLVDPARPAARPGYHLNPSDHVALQTFIAERSPEAGMPAVDGQAVLRERQCLGCHARDAAPGLAARLPEVVGRFPDLAPRLPRLTPPALTSVGDKLHDQALADAIALRRPPLRPWLATRMPRFDLSAAEFESLLNHLTVSDRIPDRPAAKVDVSPTQLEHDGSRLVTAAGFGCTSCHAIGHWQPVNVALAAQGTDLSRLGQRIRRPWFDRWVRNPARIAPRMEMPAIQIPALNVLGENLDRQLAAVWHVLNLPGFEPPQPGPVRVARPLGPDRLPVVITDVIELSGRTPATMILRPFVVGLPNRHNVLFDLSRNRLAGWWVGDTARQHTRGKSWYWEPAGNDLMPHGDSAAPELSLVHGQRVLPPENNAALAELDWYESTSDGVRFGYRLRFADDGEPLTVRVEQRLTAVADGRSHGFRRRLEIHAPAAWQARLRLLSGGETVADGRGGLRLANNANASIRLRAPAFNDVEFAAEGCQASLSPNEQGLMVCEVDYLTDEPNEPAASLAEEPIDDDWAGAGRKNTLAKLPVVPGFDVERLPLPRSEMPTGLAWRPDGTLAFCSLKGGVWLAHDSDGDGLEDELRRVADGLPAPYGIASHDESLDVCAKYGVVRLSGFDDRGRAARAEVIASGWGYSRDYHDWTVGLPRDADGNYYIALPCQQDERTPTEAYLRGTIVRLLPRQPSADDPRLYALDPLSAGLRFPMGLALDRRGELFASDNQGNYTPFNELNHVRRGRRYGFINRLEVKAGFTAPFDNPAVAVPHPWTRSVNGICFLDDPAGAGGVLDKGGFGPFAGHLIGCEYDTRRLVRMSIEKVGDTFQGAVYPFSIEPDGSEETFEGPVVCAVSPTGDLYVGNLRDSGWGGGQNTGSIVRLRRRGELPPGIAEVRSLTHGFEIQFTQPVSAEAGDAANYAISSYRREVTPAYGGLDLDRREETIEAIEVAGDSRSVRLTLRGLRRGFVYEFHLHDLASAGQPFFPAEAYYTVR